MTLIFRFVSCVHCTVVEALVVSWLMMLSLYFRFIIHLLFFSQEILSNRLNSVSKFGCAIEWASVTSNVEHIRWTITSCPCGLPYVAVTSACTACRWLCCSMWRAKRAGGCAACAQRWRWRGTRPRPTSANCRRPRARGRTLRRGTNRRFTGSGSCTPTP